MSISLGFVFISILNVGVVPAAPCISEKKKKQLLTFERSRGENKL